MRYVANSSNHRQILNDPRMVAMVGGKAKRVAAIYRATTKKRTGRNASKVMSYTETNSSRYGDRAGGFVKTWGAYNLQRELGGKRNAMPEFTLGEALAAAGGDRNLHVHPGRFVAAGGARSFRKRGGRR